MAPNEAARTGCGMKLRSGDVGLILGLAAVYVIAARLGLRLDAVSGFATLVWPPTGISIAAVVLLGYRVWPGVFIGALVANLLTGATASVALAIAAGNALEAVAGTYLLRSAPSFSRTLESVESTVGVILVALSCTIISATIGVTSLSIGGIVSAPQVGDTWRAWWV